MPEPTGAVQHDARPRARAPLAEAGDVVVAPEEEPLSRKRVKAAAAKYRSGSAATPCGRSHASSKSAPSLPAVTPRRWGSTASRRLISAARPRGKGVGPSSNARSAPRRVASRIASSQALTAVGSSQVEGSSGAMWGRCPVQSWTTHTASA